MTTDYRYTRETSDTAMNGIQSVRLDGELRVSDKWRLRGGYELNIYDKKEIERAMGISYQSRCWGLTLDCSYQQGDRRIGLMFNLAGLGNIGG